MQRVSQAFTGKRIVLGVTGGIAAYKSADLVRRLLERDAEVRVVMTRGACGFVTPLTFQAVSGQPVHTNLLDTAAEAAMGHIELARWADLVLVAPATADFMARLSAGLADDLLTTLCLATSAEVVLAPAMNQQMWAHAATRANAQQLVQRGIRLLGPASGDQACGEIGPGRMLEPLQICDGLLPATDWQGLSVLITAGPTLEDLDPVRYLGNRSSGKMGFALAAQAAAAGAQVCLVAGPVQLDTPAGVERVDIRSASQMHQAVLAKAGKVDVFIAAAAVADFRPVEQAPEKLKKGQDQSMTLELKRNPDILAEVAALTTGRPLTVGFAAETSKLVEHARSKLVAKGIDLIAANQVGGAQGGFDSDDNALEVLSADSQDSIPMTSKAEAARRLLNIILDYRNREERRIANG
jgi:phosphopantothenoylcysteine decarboxylase/phosphopantothenate--cysteine ligase